MSQTEPTDETSLAGLDDDSFNIHDYAVEDFLTLGIFWLLALDVFMQFFSRYVLGNSIAWTEEMARYLLVMVGFMGSTMAVRKGSHIAVEFFYRYMPGWLGRAMSTLVDLINIAFFASMAVALIGGLGVATLLTLVVLPVVYCVLYRIKIHAD